MFTFSCGLQIILLYHQTGWFGPVRRGPKNIPDLWSNRPERANCFMLHIAAFVMHCQLPNIKASRGAACRLSQLARRHEDAWSAWHRLHTGMAVWVHEARK